MHCGGLKMKHLALIALVVQNTALVLIAARAVILLHLPLPVVGVSIEMQRGRPQNNSLAVG